MHFCTRKKLEVGVNFFNYRVREYWSYLHISYVGWLSVDQWQEMVLIMTRNVKQVISTILVVTLVVKTIRISDSRTQGNHTCNSKNLTYKLESTLHTQCPARLISFTYTLHKRMNDHRHDVETNKENLMANHANYQN